MSRTHIPFFLSEAVITLYASNAAGVFTGTAAVWWSGPARSLNLAAQLEGVLTAASGDAYRTEHQVDEEHQIQIGSTWLVQRSDQRDFQLQRGNYYVLQIVWIADGVLKLRTYFGVTAQSWKLASAATNEFMQALQLRAQYVVEGGQLGPATVINGVVLAPSGGSVPSGGGIVTPTGNSGAEEIIGFFHEDVFFPGDYFLGCYQWAGAVTMMTATAYAAASQGVGVTLALELNGTLTGDVINLPTGAANTTVTGTVNLGARNVAPGTLVRWKVTAGPADGERAGWQGWLGMNVKVV